MFERAKRFAIVLSALLIFAGNRATARLLDVLVTDGWVTGPRFYDETRVSLNRIDAHPTTTSGLDPRDAGFAITPSNPTALGLPNIGVNGFFNSCAT